MGWFFCPRDIKLSPSQAGGLLHGKKGWPLSVLRFWIQTSWKVALAGHFVWCFLVHSVFRVYWRCTRNNLSLPGHFCISLFLKVRQSSKFEIAGAESLKVHQGPEIREPDLCVSHPCVSLSQLCHSVLQELPSLWGKKNKRITSSLFASLLFPALALGLYCIYINFFFFYCSFLSLILNLKEEKGAFDFGNEVAPAIPNLSTCYLLFLLAKSVWALQALMDTTCSWNGVITL